MVLRLSFLLILICACGGVYDDPDVGDGRDDAFVSSEKADEASTEARAILRIVNESPLSVLVDRIGGVALVSRTAREIFAYRAGRDGRAGTADDRRIASLAELDRIPYVGRVALRRLREFARRRGLTPPARSNDPFDAASCAGAPLTPEVARARIAGGRAVLGRYTLVKRSRLSDCSSGLCRETGEVTTTTRFALRFVDGTGYAEWIELTGTVRLVERDGGVFLELAGDDSAGASCRIGATGVACGEYSYYDPITRISSVSIGAAIARLEGLATDTCLRLSARGYESDAVRFAGRNEVEIALLLSYCSGATCPRSGAPASAGVCGGDAFHEQRCYEPATAATTCCLRSKVTCPGHGCTCYDACG